MKLSYLIIFITSIINGSSTLEKNTLFIAAAKEDDFETIKFLANTNNLAHLNQTDEDKRTALHYATIQENKLIVACLLYVGIDSGLRDIYGLTAFHYALRQEHYGIIEYFIDAEDDIDACSKTTDTPLIYAVRNNRLEICKFLIKGRARVNKTNSYSETPIMVAVMKGYYDIIDHLITCKANLNQIRGATETALTLAARLNMLEMCQFLVEKRANINATNDSKETPLMAAAQEGYYDVCKFLLSKGAKVDLRNDKELSAFDLATHRKHYNIMRLLLKHGADCNSCGKESVTPLLFAAQNNELDLCVFLIREGADCNHANTKKVTPLVAAVINGHFEMCTFLLKHGATINPQPEKSLIPLLCAIEKNNPAMVTFLLEQGATVNAHDAPKTLSDVKIGVLPPLYLALSLKHHEITKILLTQRAELTLTTLKNSTPYREVIKKVDPTLRNIIMKHLIRLKLLEDSLAGAPRIFSMLCVFQRLNQQLPIPKDIILMIFGCIDDLGYDVICSTLSRTKSTQEGIKLALGLSGEDKTLAILCRKLAPTITKFLIMLNSDDFILKGTGPTHDEVANIIFQLLLEIINEKRESY